jgi:hypothetical protein
MLFVLLMTKKCRVNAALVTHSVAQVRTGQADCLLQVITAFRVVKNAGLSNASRQEANSLIGRTER